MYHPHYLHARHPLFLLPGLFLPTERKIGPSETHGVQGRSLSLSPGDIPPGQRLRTARPLLRLTSRAAPRTQSVLSKSAARTYTCPRSLQCQHNILCHVKAVQLLLGARGGPRTGVGRNAGELWGDWGAVMGTRVPQKSPSCLCKMGSFFVSYTSSVKLIKNKHPVFQPASHTRKWYTNSLLNYAS